jgi:hypothetical protein
MYYAFGDQEPLLIQQLAFGSELLGERSLGVWARGVLRFWVTEHRENTKTSFSFSAGVGFRF